MQGVIFFNQFVNRGDMIVDPPGLTDYGKDRNVAVYHSFNIVVRFNIQLII